MTFEHNGNPQEPEFSDSRDLSKLADVPTDTAHEQVLLLGRPPIGEFIGLVTTQTIGGESADIGTLVEEWRQANDHTKRLETEEAGLADRVSTTSLADELALRAAEIAGSSYFKKSYAIVPAGIRMVELDPIVVYQKHIDLEHVRRIQATLGPHPSDAAVLDMCLPGKSAGYRPPVNGRRIGQNAFMFTSKSNDFRFLEPALLRPEQIVGYTPPGYAEAVVALVVGFTANCLSVLKVGNRLLLHNGSHRAYALRELGVMRAPAVVQHISRREELELFGVPALLQRSDEYLNAARPPLLKDYFNPRLRKSVMVPTRYQQVTIEYGNGGGWVDMPAA